MTEASGLQPAIVPEPATRPTAQDLFEQPERISNLETGAGAVLDIPRDGDRRRRQRPDLPYDAVGRQALFDMEARRVAFEAQLKEVQKPPTGLIWSAGTGVGILVMLAALGVGVAEYLK